MWLAATLVVATVLSIAIIKPSLLLGWVCPEDPRIDRLRLAAYAGDVGALEWIAQEQGFFRKVGLDVEMEGYLSGRQAVNALLEGRVDLATASDFVVTSESFFHPDLRVVGNIAFYRNKGIVGRRDRGIVEPRDLKGKRIGLTSPSGAEYTLYLFLASHGLSDRDVTTVSLSPEEIVREMSSGNIDAAITWQPHVQTLQTMLEDNGTTFEGGVFDVYLLLVTQQKVLAEHQAAIVKLLRALVMAEEWADANPSAAKALIASRFKLDSLALERQWQQMHLSVTLPQALLVAMDGEARWLVGHEKRNDPVIPNYSSFIEAEALRAVKPSSVTLFTDPVMTRSNRGH